MRWIMSETVNMPAKQDFSLFHSGADTTPEAYIRNENGIISKSVRNRRRSRAWRGTTET